MVRERVLGRCSSCVVERRSERGCVLYCSEEDSLQVAMEAIVKSETDGRYARVVELLGRHGGEVGKEGGGRNQCAASSCIAAECCESGSLCFFGELNPKFS